MFRSTVLRLTLYYLALVMLLSMFFSVDIYRLATSGLDQLQERQESIFSHIPDDELPPSVVELNNARIAQIKDSKLTIQNNLISFNLIILLISGLLSYLLAKRTLEPIEDAMESQKRFTADASHELRTPLTAMKAEIEVALRDDKLSLAEAKDLLGSNLEEVQKLTRLSNALLTLASLGKDERPAFQECSLATIIEEAAKNTKAASKLRHTTVTVTFQEGFVSGDPNALAEMVAILIDNAIKYSPERSEVSVSAAVQGNHALISVEDQGQGIDAHDLPHIFDRFYRSDLSRTQGQAAGYGLGLSIADKIATVHRGHIAAKSQLGHGSVFTVTLPLAKKA